MLLTETNKQYIDGLNYGELLKRWRFAPSGNAWFQGETGEYWSKRMTELRSLPGGQEKHVAASKSIGW